MPTPLREALMDFTHYLRTWPAMEGSIQLERFVEQSLPSDNTAFPADGKNYKALQRKLQKAAKMENWSLIKPEEWQQAIQLLWYGSKHHYLAADDNFLSALWSNIQGDRLALKRLMRVYFYDFHPDKPNISLIGDFISDSLKNLSKNQKLLPSTTQNKRYQIFAGEAGIKKLAKACVENEPLPLLAKLGFSEGLLQSNYIQAVYLQALQALSNRLLTGDVESLQRIFNWSVQGEQLRYSHARRTLVVHLLNPWLKRAPPPNVQLLIQQFLLEYLQDPRIEPGLWQGIDKELMAIFHQWLTAEALETFFTVLTQADKTQQSRQRFWAAYYQQGWLKGAWLALTAQESHALENQLSDVKSFEYATLNGRGAASVLLLQIQHLRIAEWNHDGKCYIWLVENPHAPRLYQINYSRDALTQKSEKIKSEPSQAGITHYEGEKGNWQTDVADFIAEKTGIRLKEHEQN